METDTKQSALEVDLPLRTNEKQQLEYHLPNIVDYLEQIGLEKEADDLDEIEFYIAENPSPPPRYLATTSVDEWRTVFEWINHEYSNETWWLKKKLVKRFRVHIDDLLEAVNSGDTDD